MELVSAPAQPPGVPEICKKNITSCPVTGGEELWIFGKNFLKDTKVVFQKMVGELCLWEQSVVPDKEFLQQVSWRVYCSDFVTCKLVDFTFLITLCDTLELSHLVVVI